MRSDKAPTRKELLKDLERVNKLTDKPVTHQIYLDEGKYSIYYFDKLTDGWSNAKKELGIPLTKEVERDERMSKKQVLDYINSVQENLKDGKIVTWDIVKKETPVTRKDVHQHFKNFSEARQEAGALYRAEKIREDIKKGLSDKEIEEKYNLQKSEASQYRLEVSEPVEKCFKNWKKYVGKARGFNRVKDFCKIINEHRDTVRRLYHNSPVTKEFVNWYNNLDDKDYEIKSRLNQKFPKLFVRPLKSFEEIYGDDIPEGFEEMFKKYVSEGKSPLVVLAGIKYFLEPEDGLSQAHFAEEYGVSATAVSIMYRRIKELVDGG